ncbi:uncharacterized protein VP01_12093g1, partial [Puccinia sorghi]
MILFLSFIHHPLHSVLSRKSVQYIHTVLFINLLLYILFFSFSNNNTVLPTTITWLVEAVLQVSVADTQANLLGSVVFLTTNTAKTPTGNLELVIGLHAITYPESFPNGSSKVAFAISFMTDYAAT